MKSEQISLHRCCFIRREQIAKGWKNTRIQQASKKRQKRKTENIFYVKSVEEKSKLKTISVRKVWKFRPQNEQEVRQVRENGLPDWRAKLLGQAVAQVLLQMPSLQYDPEHEELQRLRQVALLRRSCPEGKEIPQSFYSGQRFSCTGLSYTLISSPTIDFWL